MLLAFCCCVAVSTYNGFVVFLFCFSASCIRLNRSFSGLVCLQTFVAMQENVVLHFTLSAGVLRGRCYHSVTRLQTIET